jgi:hypothetical protein
MKKYICMHFYEGTASCIFFMTYGFEHNSLYRNMGLLKRKIGSMSKKKVARMD